MQQLAMTQSASLFDAAVLQSVTARIVESATTLPMEALHQNFGFVLYSTTFEGPLNDKLFVQDLADRALVFVDGAYKGVLQRSATQQLSISAGPGAHKLDILVENMGRINFGTVCAHDTQHDTRYDTRMTHAQLHTHA